MSPIINTWSDKIRPSVKYHGLVLLVVALVVGCNPSAPNVDLTPLQAQISELKDSVKLLELKEPLKEPALPEAPFQIGAYKYANVEGVIRLNRSTGETWLLIKGSTNHPAGWVPLVELERVEKTPELDLQPLK